MRPAIALPAALVAVVAAAVLARPPAPGGATVADSTTDRQRVLGAAAPDKAYDVAFVADDYEYCLTCHGAGGQGNETIGAPVLAGMERWYLRRQLEGFRDGWRGTHEDDLFGMEMRPIATALAPAQVPEVVDYLAALPARRAPATLAGDAAAGRDLYAAACASCHGDGARGREALAAPALAYQADWYLARQLEHYRGGVRGADPADERGRAMQAAAGALADAGSVRDVVAYIKALDAAAP